MDLCTLSATELSAALRRRDVSAVAALDAVLERAERVAVPIGLGDDGLPVALQILGPRGADAAVLAAAETVERLAGFTHHPLETTT